MEEKKIEFGFVYIIKHKTNITLKYYVGSTNNVTNRLKDHKSYCNNSNSKKYNKPLYQYIRKNGGFDKFEMIVIYENKPDYKWFEARYIYATFHYNLNDLIPWRTIEEKKQRYAEWSRKQYYLTREKYNKKRKEKIKCKICGSFVRRSDMARHQKSARCLAAQNS